MKIVLAIPSLLSGGAERVISTMANYWAERGEDIFIVTFSAEESFYPLHNKVNHIRLDLPILPPKNKFADLLLNLKKVRGLRKVFRKIKPDSVISFMTHMNVSATLAARLEKLPIIISERGDPS